MGKFFFLRECGEKGIIEYVFEKYYKKFIQFNTMP